MTPLLQVKKLEKSYGGKKVVDGLSFSLFEKEVVGLLGPNGAGKTTAFYMTIGLIRPDRGQVFFKGEEVTSLPIHKRAKMGLGYLAQEPSVFRSMTVEENLLCILQTQNLPRQTQKEELEKYLIELGLAHLRKKKAATLSGGERRRLEITRSLITKPSLLLLDEPFAGIDPLAIEDVKELICHLTQKNITVFITDHNAREIFSIAQRSYLIFEGKVMLSGTTEELLNHAEARKHYFGENFKL